jgi:hypothetical protein
MLGIGGSQKVLPWMNINDNGYYDMIILPVQACSPRNVAPALEAMRRYRTHEATMVAASNVVYLLSSFAFRIVFDRNPGLGSQANPHLMN